MPFYFKDLLFRNQYQKVLGEEESWDLQNMAKPSYERISVLGPCFLCPTTVPHVDEINRIVEKAKKNHPIKDPEEVRSKQFCTVKTPLGNEPMSLNDIEKRYEKDFPSWNKDFQCFPEGPIFYDTLFKKKPFTRAIDIEKKILDLKKKVNVLFHIPFDFDKGKFISEGVFL